MQSDDEGTQLQGAMEMCQVFIWDALRNLVPFAQYKKREKHPWRSVTFEGLQLY